MLLNVSCLNHAFYHLDQIVRMVKFGSLIQSMGFFISKVLYVCVCLFILLTLALPGIGIAFDKKTHRSKFLGGQAEKDYGRFYR